MSSIFFFGCETSFVAQREELRFRVFENRVLRRIFGLERKAVTGGGGGQRSYTVRSYIIYSLY
jgi:hypothetical protein